MISVPNVSRRRPKVIEFFINNKPDVTKYRIRVHRTLDGAFTGSVAIFEVEKGTHYLSRRLRQRGFRGSFYTSLGNTTKATIDIDDFTSVSSVVPNDRETVYMRVEDFRPAAGGYTAPGQILVVPPFEFFGMVNSVVAVTGSAPGISAVVGDSPPPTALCFAMPLATKSVTLLNLDPANNLLISTNEGGAMIPIVPQRPFEISDGSIVELYAASSTGAAVNFSATFTLDKV